MAQGSEKSIPEKARKTVRQTADAAAETVTQKAKAEAKDLRDTAADEAGTAADAAQAAADEFDAGSVQAQAIEQVAQRIDDLANQIRNTDIDRVARRVGDAAQRNPLMFVAGATLAGFAVTRFLKSRDPHTRQSAHDHDYGDPWDSGTGYDQGPSHPVPPRGGAV